VLFAILFACAAVGPSMADGPGSNVRADGIVVVTHLDIIPTFVDQARPVLDDFVADSRSDPGVVVFKMISWTPTTNHFQLIEVFESQKAFDAHVSAAHTIAFRHDIQAFIGAPYDERIYAFTNHPARSNRRRGRIGLTGASTPPPFVR
jgi:quinol monooxygenase YgiN